MRMMASTKRISTLCLVVISILEVVYSFSNGSSVNVDRKPRGHRVVKLYTGRKREAVLCTREGFLPDPIDCSIFYRCVRGTRGKYTAHRYQCGPGTIFDPKEEVCTHQLNNNQLSCQDVSAKIQTKKDIVTENHISNINTRKKLPIENTSQVTKTKGLNHDVNYLKLSSELTDSKNQTTKFEKDTFPTLYNQEISTLRTKVHYSENLSTKRIPFTISLPEAKKYDQTHSIFVTTDNFQPTIAYNNDQYSKPTEEVKNLLTRNPTKKGTEICTEEGFTGDTENCKKFYRCVGTGHGNFIKYDFFCSDSTLWDDDRKACNYQWLIKQSKCGKSNSENDRLEVEDLQTKITNLVEINTSTTHRISIPLKSKKLHTNMSQEANVQIDFQTNHTGKNHNIIMNQNFEFNNTKNKNISQNKIEESINKTTHSQKERKPSKQCTESGFIGDPEDTKKFYRCVDNGKGYFTRYEFTCSVNTIWDPEIESCNHERVIKDHAFKTVTKPSKELSLNLSSLEYSSTESIISDINKENGSYRDHTSQYYEFPTNITISPATDYTLVTIQQTSSTEVKNKILLQETECNQDGFIGHPLDCKKFFRCVDNGKGGFIRHEYVCGEGTVWDSQIQSCNHIWATKNCENSDLNHDSVVTISTKPLTTVSLLQSTSQVYDSQHEDYGQHIITTSTTSMIQTTSPVQDNNEYNICKSTGFMGDNRNCEIFYRCVELENGEYTRYEYSCGEGTLWDPQIEACNHAWAVKNCGSISHTAEIEGDVYSAEPAINNNEMDDVGYIGSETENFDKPVQNNHSSIQTTTVNINPSKNNDCRRSGFMGDSQDCRKFYRCIDNGKGGYIRYEFSCGEGTLWDENIQSCNHQWAVNNCRSSSEDKTQNVSYITVTYLPNESNFGNETTSTEKLTTFQDSNQEDNVCVAEGFMGHLKDCRLFYRCVDNGRGGFIKYEFSCGEGTVWDDEIKACNHGLFTNCGNNSGEWASITSKKPNTVSDEIETTTKSSVSTTIGHVVLTLKPSISDNCKSEGFYGDLNDCKKFYRCVSDGKGNYLKYDFRCADGTTWDQQIQNCNYGSDANVCLQKLPVNTDNNTTDEDSTSDIHSTTMILLDDSITQKPNVKNQCISEGFFPDTKDCQRFYRCVSDGKSSFAKYEFTCGEGTMWVQEIQACDHANDIENCKKEIEPSIIMSDEQSTSAITTIIPPNDEQHTENENTSDSPVNSYKCQSEGYYPNKKDCRRFYRCVDNGKDGYTRHDFICGEGTAWDINLQTCNHIADVQSCSKIASSGTAVSKPEEHITVTESSSPNAIPETTNPSTKDKCKNEGYFGNSQDCKRFYRCVDNGNGGFTKYEFSCGEGTIWDQDVITCNHPQDVNTVSCKMNETSLEETTGQSVSSSTSNDSTSSASSSTDLALTSSSSESESNKNISCNMPGYYAHPKDCKKFYRCVDWDGDGKKFSIFYFECGEGTIWDPSLNTCNHENSVYPQRQCSNSNPQGENTETTTDTFTTQETTTMTTEKLTTKIQSTNEKLTTSKKTTPQPTTNTHKTSTLQTSSIEPTTQQAASTQTTTNQYTTSEQTTTQQSSSSTQNTTEQTTVKTTANSTINESTTEQTTTHQSTTTDELPQSTTTEEIIESTVQSTSGTENTTESNESTTENNSLSKECPETKDDQYLYVCPTSFKRHPKYCNMFYQCDEDNESHEVNTAIFQCPNNTIYDESKTKCINEKEADKTCDGQIAQKRRLKRLNTNFKEPIIASDNTLSCKAVGYYPFEKYECSPAFLKCKTSKYGVIQGYVYQCPTGYIYWSISKRCERSSILRDCKRSANDWTNRWYIPVERKNVAH